MERIHSTGCVVKDLDVGLLDFPARMDNQNVYLCWRLGEDRIRFYHRQDEGFARASQSIHAIQATAARFNEPISRFGVKP